MMKKEIPPAAMIAAVVLVLAVVVFLGVRALQPPPIGADTAPKPVTAGNEQINGVNVPKNVPSYYYKEHQNGEGAAPTSSGPADK